MSQLIGVFGASGFAREVMPLVRQQLLRCGDADSEVVFVDIAPSDSVNGVAVIAEQDFLVSNRDRAFVVAVADGRLREKLHTKVLASGATPISVRADSSKLLDEVDLGHGAVLCHNSILTSNIKVGVGFHLNIFAYVAHDCIVGDWVTFGPKVACNGNVVIEDYCYIGTGALIRQGQPGAPIVIGAGATIGMGAVVTKSVPAGAVVIGNPARELKKDLDQ